MREGSLALVDLGTAGGEWMFRRDGMMFGPVPASAVVDALMAGEIDGETAVGREGDPLQPLREVAFFRSHLPRAEVLRREREAQRAAAARARRMRNTRAAAMAVAGAAG